VQPALIDLMQQRVRTIYRALTGADMPEAPPEPEREMPAEEVTRRFVALETLARTDPSVAERIPPFSFTPGLDMTANGGEIVVELAVPGVDRDDVSVGVADDLLVISGFRRDQTGLDHLAFAHAEIPRGPFYREVHLPWSVHAAPEVDLERGLLRVRLRRSPASPASETHP
jgi:HSP20 family molecular chaperone IbpA